MGFILILIILIGMLWLWSSGSTPGNSDDMVVIDQLQEVSKRLVLPHIHIVPSNNGTYTEDYEKIFIVLRNLDGKMLDLNTIKHSFIHELAHVDLRSDLHNNEFYDAEKRLIQKATCGGLIDGDNKHDYHCFDPS